MDDEAILEEEALSEAEGEDDAARKARRQAMFREQAGDFDENSLKRRASNRYLRNTRAGRVLLGKGQKPAKPRIGKVDYAILMSVAGFFDILSFLLNLIPYVGGVISMVVVTIPGTLTFYILYKKRGVEFKTTKGMLRFWGSSLIEMIPVINILPGFMLNVTLVSSMTALEDKKK